MLKKTSAGITVFVWVLLLFSPAMPQAAKEVQQTPRPIQLADVASWKRIQSPSISNDGQWFAYRLGPGEGDGEIVIRSTSGSKELRFPAGELQGFSFSGSVSFSEDSKWVAYTIYPNAKEAKKLKKERKPLYNKAGLVNLSTGKKVEFDKIRRYTFSGEQAGWLALHRYTNEAQEKEKEKWGGSDLLLYELSTGNQLNLGNVSEFAFDKKGEWLAWIVDAQDKTGNGLQIRNMSSGITAPLDSEAALYKSLNWTEKGDGLAALRGVEDKRYEEKLYSVVGFRGLSGAPPQKTVYDPKEDKSFPAGMTISANRAPVWTEDGTGLIFGITEVKKKEEKKGDDKPNDDKPKGDEPKAAAPEAAKKGDDGEHDKPDMVIWHWKDTRLQSQQQVEESRDKNFSYLAVYRTDEKRFIRLADDNLRQVNPAPRHRWAIGVDTREYEWMGNLDGRRYQDIYAVDMKTGERKLAVKKSRYYFGPSPEGSHFLYYDDGHFFTYEMASGRSYNITQQAPTVFVNVDDDRNIVKPPTRSIGWLKDGAGVLISDGWDVWHLPAHGGQATNLTVNGKKDRIRYRARFQLDPEEKGIDISKPVYFSTYGEWTKKTGISLVENGKPGAKVLLWDDAGFGGLMKAKSADRFLYTRETYDAYPDYYVAGGSLEGGERLTAANPQQKDILWSKGVKLIDYTSAKGDKLQGALYLPANYEPGKSYPTIVYIYEKLSQGLNSYTIPGVSGFNKSVYTSNGYAVLMPDIVYKINDPGMSAVWCVVPAVNAAIATGIVDKNRIGLQGHSWGGYQSSFLVTQTDIFKAAVAGAPLTNLISMYSSVYWNTGSANQPIFESSQGRFTSGYWDNMEAYTRNSPVYFARNVKTPLMILHNDKDGAVDWNQGIEYFNTLRRLQKPVIMLQYKGENHGLREPANMKDYTLRMREFFDHYLMDKPAPAWMVEGVPHLKLKEHLDQRVKESAKPATP